MLHLCFIEGVITANDFLKHLHLLWQESQQIIFEIVFSICVFGKNKLLLKFRFKEIGLVFCYV